MKILVTGATGLIGSKLIEALFLKGYSDIRVLSRDRDRAERECPFPIAAYHWNPAQNAIDASALAGVDVIVHLAGENVAGGRWNSKRKNRILDSRVEGSALLVKAVQEADPRPRKLISASAIGIYGDRGEEVLSAESDAGSGFLSEVCQKWEREITNCLSENLTTHLLRIGIVLAKEGGALQKMLPAFKAGVAGRLGSGRQYMSWIHIDDLVGQLLFLMEGKGRYPVYNGVSPNPVTNQMFTKVLGRQLKRPTILPAPEFGLNMMLGEMASLLLQGQRVKPSRFIEDGYRFRFERLEDALKDLLQREVCGEGTLIRYQCCPQKVGRVFQFFSDEKNLEKITPPHLNFKVLGKSSADIQEGTIIDYKLSLHGFPLKWKTRINAFEHEKRFVDEQIKGPYSKWIHTHDFIPVGDSTIIRDEIVYKIPFGAPGRLLGGPLVRRDLEKIFDYRKEAVKTMLGALLQFLRDNFSETNVSSNLLILRSRFLARPSIFVGYYRIWMVSRGIPILF